MDSYRQSLMIFYLKELSLADEREEFMRLYTPEIEGMLHSLLSFSDVKKEDVIQIITYANGLQTSMKVA